MGRFRRRLFEVLRTWRPDDWSSIQQVDSFRLGF